MGRLCQQRGRCGKWGAGCRSAPSPEKVGECRPGGLPGTRVPQGDLWVPPSRASCHRTSSRSCSSSHRPPPGVHAPSSTPPPGSPPSGQPWAGSVAYAIRTTPRSCGAELGHGPQGRWQGARLAHPRPQALCWPAARCPPWPAHGRTPGGPSSVAGELRLGESFPTACPRPGRGKTAGSSEVTVLGATLPPAQPVGHGHGRTRPTFLTLARGPRPTGAGVTDSPISAPGSNRCTDSHTQPRTREPAGTAAARPGVTPPYAALRPRGLSRAGSRDRVCCFLPHPSLRPPPPKRSLAPRDGTPLSLPLPRPWRGRAVTPPRLPRAGASGWACVPLTASQATGVAPGGCGRASVSPPV